MIIYFYSTLNMCGVLYFLVYFYYFSTSQNKHYLFPLLDYSENYTDLSMFYIFHHACILELATNQNV